ncbi:helix-turn-helix domain-containing protein [Jeotgalibacillus haloalkalitolerans]|uniref:Helix-turn-helix transcriptional regulator n=1 Tax=Jeotgalibacillus haloalkalitolerans TaxID=3104292 RepID=A0ABU5KI48_9BACL|nr:helix-turn-helix transcriptional regulator [Jeotgalibacillus sp. HH7-29]MDZ5710902.1 helix-turn-helix transcriptional regulator [Jeotgalibacillus sp. HH7-29]
MIGENIKKHRKEKGLTLSELAEKAGVSKSYLSNIERNLKQNPSIHVLEKISRVLEVNLQSLLKAKSENNMLISKDRDDFIREFQKNISNYQELKDYKTVLEFIKWKNKNVNSHHK